MEILLENYFMLIFKVYIKITLLLIVGKNGIIPTVMTQ